MLALGPMPANVRAVVSRLVAKVRREPGEVDERLNGFLVRFGRAFGPPGLKHFSELSTNEQQALLNRVPVLRGAHTDWLKPFQWVTRTLTVWVGPAPEMSQVIAGNVTLPLKPIPQPGEWYVLRGYMASTTAEGIHDRLGWRWDDVDLYWSLSASVKLR